MTTQEQETQEPEARTLAYIATNLEELKLLVQEVRDIAQELPEYVYNQVPGLGCCYPPDEGNPHGCIIGYALRRRGCTELEEGDYAGKGSGMFINTALKLRAHSAGVDLSPEMLLHVQWLQRVQQAQDRGVSWGVAVSDADVARPLDMGAYTGYWEQES